MFTDKALSPQYSSVSFSTWNLFGFFSLKCQAQRLCLIEVNTYPLSLPLFLKKTESIKLLYSLLRSRHLSLEGTTHP